MTEILPSYVEGAWWTPSTDAEAAEVRDSSTGEIVARVSTERLDLGAALDYARTVGQRSLGTLTFHQRAVLLKQFALALTERRLVVHGTGNIRLDVPRGAAVTTEEPGDVRLKYDAATANPPRTGEIELRLQTPRADVVHATLSEWTRPTS